MTIEERLRAVYDKIECATERAGREKGSVDLVCVTKTVPFERMKPALDVGVKIIGESKTTELIEKSGLVSPYGVEKHFIGHLQSNKAKQIINEVDLLHSLDRWSLAEALQKKLEIEDATLDVLIQVNVSKEKSKGGVFVEEIHDFVEEMRNLKLLKIKGLMTMAPYADNPENIRYVFRELKELSEKLKLKNYEWAEFEQLSMGMSNDYEIAIEEGATLVRVGSAIFGKRNY